jgi:hypothetical protein
VPSALVEQTHQFFVDGVDGFAVFLETHNRLFFVIVIVGFIVRVIVGLIGLVVEGEFFL